MKRMISFEFTEEQKMFRDMVREFLNKEVAPVVDKRDRAGPLTREECYEWYKKFQKIGVGYDPETAKTFLADRWFNAILGEEMGRVWPSLAAVLGYQAFAAMVLIASEETKNRLLPRLNRAELIGTIAVTEPEAGSDNRMIATTATPEGDDWVINGRKTWITNGTVADVALVAAINKETGMLDFFLMDRETAPWEVGELHKIGWKACPTGEMFFENCHTPKENSIGSMMATAMTRMAEGEIPPVLGGAGMMKLIETTRSPLSALFAPMRAGMVLLATGISQAAYDEAVKYAKERKQFGKPIGKMQLIQEMLYNIALINETSRLLAYRAIDMIGTGDPRARYMSSLAKCYACEKCVEATYYAIQIHGGMGLSEELPLERYFRDARMMTVPDGTTEIQKLVVGYEILGKGYSAYV